MAIDQLRIYGALQSVRGSIDCADQDEGLTRIDSEGEEVVVTSEMFNTKLSRDKRVDEVRPSPRVVR